MSGFAESDVEDAALAWLEVLGYAVFHGPEIPAGMPGADLSDPNYRDVAREPGVSALLPPQREGNNLWIPR